MTNENESVYDERVAPLMARIIKICKANGIGLVADFCMNDEEGEPLQCTTVLSGPEYATNHQHREMSDLAFSNVNPQLPPALKLTTKKADGSESVTIIQHLP